MNSWEKSKLLAVENKPEFGMSTVLAHEALRLCRQQVGIQKVENANGNKFQRFGKLRARTVGPV